jgi:hypothetical protein
MSVIPKYWDYTKPNELIDELVLNVRAKKPLANKYLYLGSSGARNWIKVEIGSDLARQKRLSLRLYLENIRKLIPEDSFDIVSLGSGTGTDDITILEHLAPKVHSPLSVIGIDLSWCLLDVGLQNISNSISNNSLRQWVDLYGLCVDFEELGKATDKLNSTSESTSIRRNKRCLFHLLGLTIGNSSEIKLLKTIHNVMDIGDYLLLNVDFSADDPEALKASFNAYNNNAVNDFLLGPLNASTRFEQNGENSYLLKSFIKNHSAELIDYTKTNVVLHKTTEVRGKEEKLSDVENASLFVRYYVDEKLEKESKNGINITEYLKLHGKLIDFSAKYKCEDFKMFLNGLSDEEIYFETMHDLKEFYVTQIEGYKYETIQAYILLKKIIPTVLNGQVVLSLDLFQERLGSYINAITHSEKNKRSELVMLQDKLKNERGIFINTLKLLQNIPECKSKIESINNFESLYAMAKEIFPKLF